MVGEISVSLGGFESIFFILPIHVRLHVELRSRCISIVQCGLEDSHSFACPVALFIFMKWIPFCTAIAVAYVLLELLPTLIVLALLGFVEQFFLSR